MNNVKKWLSLSLAGAMLMGALAGCGGDTTAKQTPPPLTTEPAPPPPHVLKYGNETWPPGIHPHTLTALAPRLRPPHHLRRGRRPRVRTGLRAPHRPERRHDLQARPG